MFREEQIGDCRLILGDCREVMASWPDCFKVDAVVTDPPYGIGISMNPVRQKHEKLNWDAHTPDKSLFDLICLKSSRQIIWGGNYFDLPPSQGFLIWDKVQPENFSLAMCEFAWCSEQAPAKLFKRHVVSFEKSHPTQKPIELMEWCILRLGATGTILDPFMGSGTTGVACVKLDRKFIGIELEPKYFDIARKRIEKAYNEPRLPLAQPKMKQEAMQL